MATFKEAGGLLKDLDESEIDELSFSEAVKIQEAIFASNLLDLKTGERAKYQSLLEKVNKRIVALEKNPEGAEEAVAIIERYLEQTNYVAENEVFAKFKVKKERHKAIGAVVGTLVGGRKEVIHGLQWLGEATGLSSRVLGLLGVEDAAQLAAANKVAVENGQEYLRGMAAKQDNLFPKASSGLHKEALVAPENSASERLSAKGDAPPEIPKEIVKPKLAKGEIGLRHLVDGKSINYRMTDGSAVVFKRENFHSVTVDVKVPAAVLKKGLDFKGLSSTISSEKDLQKILDKQLWVVWR
jgi:hypothetical protein